MNKHEYFYLLTTQVILILYCLINVPLAGSNALDVEKGLSPLYMDSPLAELVIDKVFFFCVLHSFQCRVSRFEYPPVFFERN